MLLSFSILQKRLGLTRLMQSRGFGLRFVRSNSQGPLGVVAELVGNEGGVVSRVINLESSGVCALDWRPRHDEHYHEARFFAACSGDGC